MTPKDTIRELERVLGREKPAQGVAARDFKQPRRLGPARLAELELALENLMPALEKKLAESTGLAAHAVLAGLGEADAEVLFADASAPLCVLRFRCQRAGTPVALAWLGWEPAAAVAVVEAILGARTVGAAPSAAASRKLSPIEVRLASQLLVEVARVVVPPLGLAASDFALVQIPQELGSWREAGADAQSHRFEVRLDLELGGHASRLRLYVPGIEPGSEATLQLPAELPAHLERIEVELSARLPGCQVSLDQLLALEEGDVIPLEARLGDSTLLGVEGLTLARARLGSHRGRLALRIERLDVQAESV